MTFEKGQSGNTAGRPPFSPKRNSRALPQREPAACFFSLFLSAPRRRVSPVEEDATRRVVDWSGS
jgi:hypothetical protein